MEWKIVEMNKLKRIITIFILSLLLLTSCSLDKGDKLPKKVKIGTIRVPNDKTVAYELGFFKSFFQDRGIEAELIFFDSGTAANVAFASGDLDFAEMGYTNAVVALNRGIDVELIWIHEVLGSNEALLVKKDRGIETISDLKSKTIATPFSSTSHYSLMKALELEAMTARDIKLLDMDTEDILAAWERGDIDAAYTWEPTLSHLKKDAKVLIDSQMLAEKGITTVNIELVNKAFSKKYPDLVSDYISALDKAINLYKTQESKAIDAAASNLELDKEIVKKQMESTIWLSAKEQAGQKYLGKNNNPGDFRETFMQTAEFLLAEKKIDRLPTYKDIDDFINTDYIEKVMDR